MDDVQDNIQAIDRLIDDLEDEDYNQLSDLEAKKEELTQQLDSLEEKVEVVRSQGLSGAVRPSEFVVFSDDVTDIEEIAEADWITDIIWMREETAKERFGFCPKEASKYKEIQLGADDKTKNTSLKKDEEYLIRVYERWNRSDKRVYTFIDGYEGYARPPFTPRKIGERFHGFFPLVFDQVDGSPYPQPLVSQLRSMQDEHITTRTNFREHREKSVPFNVAHGGQLDPTRHREINEPWIHGDGHPEVGAGIPATGISVQGCAASAY